MKKWFVTLSLLLLICTYSQAEIQFQHGPWQEILAQAAKENKLVFVDAYTSWCGPCKWMAANTFTDPAVAEYFNTHFINAKIDMEKGEGPELARTYNVTAYPTLLFVNAAGELVHNAIGAMDAARFLELGKNVEDPKFLSVKRMREQYAAGETDRHFLSTYILTMRGLGEKVDEPLMKFRPGMAGAALLEEDNWKVFQALFIKLDSDEAKYFLGHLSDFSAKHGEDAVQGKALAMYSTAATRTINGGTQADYDAAREVLVKSGLEGAAYRALQLDLEWYRKQENYDKYAAAAVKVVDATPDPDPNLLNNLAWNFYENVDDAKMLKTALKWIDRSLEAQREYYNLDTKAMLLHKMGKDKEAIATAEEAIARAKEIGQDYTATEKALQEMKGE